MRARGPIGGVFAELGAAQLAAQRVVACIEEISHSTPQAPRFTDVDQLSTFEYGVDTRVRWKAFQLVCTALDGQGVPMRNEKRDVGVNVCLGSGRGDIRV